MHESHHPRPLVLLPKRLAHRVPLIEPQECASAIAAGNDNWGLSERISALPGIRTIRTVLDDGVIAMDHLIDADYVLRSRYCGPHLLCHIDLEGISLAQLDPVDKEEVVFKGWASHAGDEIVLHLPRDSIEMEVAWRIILRAYQYLASRPRESRFRQKTAPDLPKFASTAKYWM